MTAEPNILFVCSDQERRDTCDCYGQLLDIRPNLDGIAREGVRFEHAFTPQLVCGPARACPQTARYATESGLYHQRCRLATPHGTRLEQKQARTPLKASR